MIDYFKFFEGPAKKERVFTDFMDALDDYHLGGIPLPTTHHMEVQATRLMRPFTLNLFVEVSGRIPTFLFAIEQSSTDDYEIIRGTTLGQLTGGELNIPWCFVSLTIQRNSDNSIVRINYEDVDIIDRMGLIFDPQDLVTITYKP